MPKPRTSAKRPRPQPQYRQAAHEQGAVTALAFSPTGAYLASGGKDARVRLWQLVSGSGELTALSERKARIEGRRKIEVTGLEFGPRWGEITIVAATDSQDSDAERVSSWAVVADELDLLHPGTVSWVGIGAPVASPLGTAVAFPGTALYWFDALARQCESDPFKVGGHSRSVAFSGDGQRVGVTVAGQVSVFDVASRRSLMTYGEESGDFQALAFLPDQPTALIGSEDGSVKLWNLANDSIARTWGAGSVPVERITPLRDGRFVVARRSSEDRYSLDLYSVDSDAPLATHEFADTTWSVAVSRDGRSLATGDADGNIELWAFDSLLSVE